MRYVLRTLIDAFGVFGGVYFFVACSRTADAAAHQILQLQRLSVCALTERESGQSRQQRQPQNVILPVLWDITSYSLVNICNGVAVQYILLQYILASLLFNTAVVPVNV